MGRKWLYWYFKWQKICLMRWPEHVSEKEIWRLKLIGAFYLVWKWHNVQRARSEIRRCTTHALYRYKLWQQDQLHNSQNLRWIATNNRDVPRVRKTKFPATVMVFGVVSSESHIMPPHIFEVCLKVNTKVYLDVLKSVVIPWCNQEAGGRP